jgi:hypothetical protein
MCSWSSGRRQVNNHTLAYSGTTYEAVPWQPGIDPGERRLSMSGGQGHFENSDVDKTNLNIIPQVSDFEVPMAHIGSAK